jgi:transcriptional regulator of arginine metabolism
MKSSRHKEIIELVKNNNIKTQEDLLLALKNNGIVTTQATVSRDIKEIGLLKIISSSGEYIYTTPINHKFNNKALKNYDILAHSIIGVDSSLNTVVVKCSTGTANAVCACLDSMEIDEIVGTLAGDDTIFVLMRTIDDTTKFINDIKTYVKNK